MNEDYLDNRDAVTRRVDAFDKKHGACLYEEPWVRFANGATREGNPNGALIEPPDDPWQRSRLIARYHRVLMERAIADFDNKHGYLTTIARSNLSGVCGPAPSINEASVELTALRSKALAAKAAYDKAKIAEERLRPTQYGARERQIADSQRENAEFLQKIGNIRL